MINTHLHRGSTVDTVSEHSPGPVTLQLHTAQPHGHSTASPVYETVLKTNTQAHTESSSTQAHSFQGSSVYVVIDAVIYGQRKKMVMLRKQQSVCCNLTCNSSGGLSGEAWGTEQCLDVCVAVCWMHVCAQWIGRGRLPTVHQG